MPDLQTTQKYVNDIDGALTKTKNTLTEAQTRCNTLIGNIRTQYGITGRMANSMTGVVKMQLVQIALYSVCLTATT